MASTTSTRLCRRGPRCRCSRSTAGATSFLTRVFSKLLPELHLVGEPAGRRGVEPVRGRLLGLDNIGPIDHSHVPEGFVLEQSDATAWMAFYRLNMLEIARELAQRTPALDDLVIKFMEHFALISNAMHRDLWDEQDGFYYMLRGPDGHHVPLRVRSMVGIMPLFTTKIIGEDDLAGAQAMRKGFAAIARAGAASTRRMSATPASWWTSAASAG